MKDKVLQLLEPIRQCRRDIISRKWLKKAKKCKNNKSKISVAFFVDMLQVWDKSEAVYKEMCNNDKFEPIILLNKDCEDFENKKAYFDNINVKNIEYIDQDFDISIKKYDYFFYQRPYANLYPLEIAVYKVIKYSKICYIPYGYSGSEVFDGGNTNKAFFRNVYLGFIDIKSERDILQKRYKYNCKRGYQKFISKGYPVLEEYFDRHDKKFDRRVLWTPRWTLGTNIGGSHFLDYKDAFINLVDEIGGIKLTIRPHPLMFSNFMNKGIMDRTEVELYKSYLKEKGIVESDLPNIADDLYKTDILITDYSSIIVEYFLTGNPIIYCPAEFDLNTEYSILIPGLYIANNWDDVKMYLIKLTQGVDPLKAVRLKIINENFLCMKDASKRVVDVIYEDYIN